MLTFLKKINKVSKIKDLNITRIFAIPKIKLAKI